MLKPRLKARRRKLEPTNHLREKFRMNRKQRLRPSLRHHPKLSRKRLQRNNLQVNRRSSPEKCPLLSPNLKNRSLKLSLNPNLPLNPKKNPSHSRHLNLKSSPRINRSHSLRPSQKPSRRYNLRRHVKRSPPVCQKPAQ